MRGIYPRMRGSFKLVAEFGVVGKLISFLIYMSLKIMKIF